MEPQRETRYPRQESLPSIPIEVEILESPSETRDMLEFVTSARPRHVYGSDVFEEDIVEVRKHGEKERHGRGGSFDGPQLQGTEGVSDGFEAPDEGVLPESTHVEGGYREVSDWRRGD